MPLALRPEDGSFCVKEAGGVIVEVRDGESVDDDEKEEGRVSVLELLELRFRLSGFIPGAPWPDLRGMRGDLLTDRTIPATAFTPFSIALRSIRYARCVSTPVTNSKTCAV